MGHPLPGKKQKERKKQKDKKAKDGTPKWRPYGKVDVSGGGWGMRGGACQHGGLAMGTVTVYGNCPTTTVTGHDSVGGGAWGVGP